MRKCCREVDSSEESVRKERNGTESDTKGAISEVSTCCSGAVPGITQEDE